MSISNITVLGGDLRQAYAAEYLSSAGCHITCFHTPCFPYNNTLSIIDSLPQALKKADAVLMPSPLSADGSHLFQKSKEFPSLSLEELSLQIPEYTTVFFNGMPVSFKQQLTKKHCALQNLAASPAFGKQNAQLTAEGLLSELIRYTPFSIKNTVTLLLGYGKCGHTIGPMLSRLKSRVYVLEKNPEFQAEAEKHGLLVLSPAEKNTILPHCSLIINTIPQHVLTEQELKLLSGNCHIFDIASSPFGFSSNITTQYALPYFRLPGLPGKFSPQTAGTIIGKTIERMIHHDI